MSALREVAAGKGVSLPVTLLAKWKTTLQLVAVGFLIAGDAGDAVVAAQLHQLAEGDLVELPGRVVVTDTVPAGQRHQGPAQPFGGRARRSSTHQATSPATQAAAASRSEPTRKVRHGTASTSTARQSRWA